jgi:hypothetical protein
LGISNETENGKLRNLLDENQTRALVDFQRSKVHAVAGIGNPSGSSRYFDPYWDVWKLTHSGPSSLSTSRYCLRGRCTGTDDGKGCGKCRRFATGREWYVPITAELTGFLLRLDILLKERVHITHLQPAIDRQEGDFTLTRNCPVLACPLCKGH